jgi:two-component system cell cycle sensor histidine kinase/response regulator CckA
VSPETGSDLLFRRLVDLAFDGVLVHVDGALIYANAAALRIVGAQGADEILGRPISDVLPLPYLRSVEQRILRGETEGLGVPIEDTLKRLDGAVVVVEVMAVAFPWQRRPAAEVFLRDVTERKRAQEELARREKQLRFVQRLDAMGQIAGGVAHEINNMMNVILSHAELLEESAPGEDGKRSAEAIRRAGERITALTRGVLAFSRRQVLQPIAIDVNAFLRGAEPLLSRVVGEETELVIRSSDQPAIVQADRHQLQQVLVNLLLNARDAMSGGGRVEIAVDRRTSVGDEEIGPGTYVVVGVTDTGHGMDDATAARVFEPFFTTRGVRGGMGLGLASAYGIARQSRGTIRVSSSPGQGARFEVWLPFDTTAPTAAPATPEPARPRAGAGRRVLLVEDEPSLRDVLARQLRFQGYVVSEAGNGRLALEALTGMAEPPEIVVTDMVMPEMNGRELAEALSVRLPGVPIVFMSGYTDEEISRRGLLAPGMSFLQKPFTFRALMGKIDQAILLG